MSDRRFRIAPAVVFLGLAAWVSISVPAARAVEPAKPPSSPAAIRQYRDAVTLQNQSAYDLAVDEWAKFLEKFPQDPLAAKAQHYLGVCKLQLKDFDAAVQTFQKVIDAYPNSELLETSYLDLGLAQYSLGQAGKAEQYDKAAATFAATLAKFPQGKEAAQALFYEGESLYAAGKKEPALKAYAEVVEKHKDTTFRADALYALGVTREELGKHAEAGTAFDQFIKEFPKHALRSEVIMRRGETLFGQGQFDTAEGWFAAAARSKNPALADQATIRQAVCLYEQKKYDAAAELYAALPTKFPNSTLKPAAALAAGNCYYLAGKLDEARKWLVEAAQSSDSAPEATHWLARVLLKQRQPAEALAAVEKILPAAGQSPFAVNLLMDQADAIYEVPARRAEAIKLYAALAEKNPQHAVAAQALYMAGFASLGQGDYAAARKYADAFLKSHPNDTLAPDVQYVAAEADLQVNKNADAEKLYRDLIAQHAKHPDVDAWKLRLALSLSLQGKHQEAVTVLLPLAGALKSKDLIAEADYLLGSAYFELKQNDKAVQSLQASVAAQPQWRQADETLLALAAAYRQLNKLPEAGAAAARVLKEFPHSQVLDRAHFRAGEYAYAAGNYPGAAAEYREVIEKFPQSPLVPHALYGLAWAQLGQKDYSAAEATLTNLLNKFPQHPLAARAHYARATARQPLHQYAPAIDDVQAFLKSEPPKGDKSDARYVEGLSRVGLKEFPKAVEIFRAILADDAGYAGADKVLYELGWALKSDHKEPEAGEAFARLAKDYVQSPLAAEGLYHVGEAHYQAKDYAAAAADYTQAVEKAGKSDVGEKALHKLSWAYYQQGDFDKARQSFELQAKTYPAGDLAADASFMASECLFKQGKFEPALAAYRKVLAKPPASKDFQVLLLLHAGQAAGQAQKWDESLKLLERAGKEFATSPFQPDVLFEQATALKNLGRPDPALELYERVTAETDREVSARARFMMGEILFEKSDYKEAVRNYFKVAYGYGYPKAPAAIQKWQANAVFEAAVCFEKMKNLDKAKKSYQEVIEKYPKSDRAAEAKQRMAALGA